VPRFKKTKIARPSHSQDAHPGKIRKQGDSKKSDYHTKSRKKKMGGRLYKTKRPLGGGKLNTSRKALGGQRLKSKSEKPNRGRSAIIGGLKAAYRKPRKRRSAREGVRLLLGGGKSRACKGLSKKKNK